MADPAHRDRPMQLLWDKPSPQCSGFVNSAKGSYQVKRDALHNSHKEVGGIHHPQENTALLTKSTNLQQNSNEQWNKASANVGLRIDMPGIVSLEATSGKMTVDRLPSPIIRKSPTSFGSISNQTKIILKNPITSPIYPSINPPSQTSRQARKREFQEYQQGCGQQVQAKDNDGPDRDGRMPKRTSLHPGGMKSHPITLSARSGSAVEDLDGLFGTSGLSDEPDLVSDRKTSEQKLRSLGTFEHKRDRRIMEQIREAKHYDWEQTTSKPKSRAKPNAPHLNLGSYRSRDNITNRSKARLNSTHATGRITTTPREETQRTSTDTPVSVTPEFRSESSGPFSSHSEISDIIPYIKVPPLPLTDFDDMPVFGGEGYNRSPFAIPEDFAAFLFGGQSRRTVPQEPKNTLVTFDHQAVTGHRTKVQLGCRKNIYISSYTISEDLSGDRGDQILSRIGDMKRDGNFRLRIESSCIGHQSPRHRGETYQPQSREQSMIYDKLPEDIILGPPKTDFMSSTSVRSAGKPLDPPDRGTTRDGGQFQGSPAYSRHASLDSESAASLNVSAKIMKHITNFPYVIPPQFNQGSPEAAKWLQEAKSVYGKILVAMESATAQIAALESMQQKRVDNGNPYTTEEEKNFKKLKEATLKHHNDTKRFVDNFRQQQKLASQKANQQWSGAQQGGHIYWTMMPQFIPHRRTPSEYSDASASPSRSHLRY